MRIRSYMGEDNTMGRAGGRRSAFGGPGTRGMHSGNNAAGMKRRRNRRNGSDHWPNTVPSDQGGRGPAFNKPNRRNNRRNSGGVQSNAHNQTATGPAHAPGNDAYWGGDYWNDWPNNGNYPGPVPGGGDPTGGGPVMMYDAPNPEMGGFGGGYGMGSLIPPFPGFGDTYNPQFMGYGGGGVSPGYPGIGGMSPGYPGIGGMSPGYPGQQGMFGPNLSTWNV